MWSLEKYNEKYIMKNFKIIKEILKKYLNKSRLFTLWGTWFCL